MSKINKIRFVNLNYNNNSMTIEDESFYLDGENTLLNLRNGGGKSVLVQMMMAPFVNRRFRKTEDRTFESYFTSSTPTYILVEWKLDDGAGYLLTGMMVRKKDASSDENSKEKLDIINFIHEYKEKNIYDINSIPVIEEKSNRRVIKSYANSKKLFEDLKKNKEIKFNYYDMNNSITTKNYFNKLIEYKIDHKEWETIIKKINLKESGLSELFNKAKNTSGLVKEWFLPAIEDKLKKDEDRVDNYRGLMDSYIKQYRANKFNIDKKAKIEIFNNLAEELFLASDMFIENIENKVALENKIANTINYLKKSLRENEELENELEQLIIGFEDKIRELNYEKDSIKIYKEEEKKNKLIENIENSKLEIKESSERKNNFKRRGNIVQCAKAHREYQELSTICQQYETELRILTDKNRENAPKINDLGFTIKTILESEIIDVNASKNENIENKKLLEGEKSSIRENLSFNRSCIGNLKVQKGYLESKVASFTKSEENFNKNYEESLFRNIEGYFDEEKILLTEKEINNLKAELDRNKGLTVEELLKAKENLKIKDSEKAINIKESLKVKGQLENEKLKFNKFKEELENRKELIKYIDFDESKIFNNEEIIISFERKIALIKDEERKLRKLSDEIINQLEKLKTGKLLELPKDIENKLKEKGIKIVYGMEWLKKNGYSLKENEKLIKENPFIAYSLIMDSKEIKILEEEALDVFTSNPISIINRTNLEENNYEIKENIISFNNIKFFISFNNKLLNEEELLKLIKDKEKEIEEKNKIINSKIEAIELYEDKKNIIKYSKLTLNGYEELKINIEQLENKEKFLREEEKTIERLISKIKLEIEENEKDIKVLEKDIEKNNNKLNSFSELKEDYKSYVKNKKELKVVEEKLAIIEKEIIKNEKRDGELEFEIEDIKERIKGYIDNEKEIQRNLDKFKIYHEGEFLKRDKEDLLAEYNALTKEITSSEKELKIKASESLEKFKVVETDLNTKADSYKIKEEEYKNESYSIEKELEINDKLEKESENLDLLKEALGKIKTELALVENKIESLYKKLKKDFDKESLKKKELLIEKDFKEEISKLNVEIREKNQSKKEVVKLKNLIGYNLSSLNEFNNISIGEELEIIIDFNQLDEAIGMLKRDLNNLKNKENESEKNLIKLTLDIDNREEFKNESLFKDPITVLKGLTANPVEFKNQLKLSINSYEHIIGKLKADIEQIEEEENNILRSLMEYIKDVHENIEKIDDNSSITIKGKSIKMLSIEVANWEENIELYKIRLKDYVEQIRNQSIKSLEKNENIEEILSGKININKLYEEIIGIGTVNIKLYKIEEDKQRKISWDEVSKNSGGEGFLSAFVILSSLMSYMRKNEKDIFTRKEGGKVLIMDNPFAQTNASHLLKPLMDIAKKSNTQLICLTGLGGDAIYNRFDNIYLLNLISSKLRGGLKYLKAEHTKGEEEKEEQEIETIVSSRFKIEEQTKLF